MKQHLEQLKKEFDGDLHYDAVHKNLYATDASVYRKIPLAVAFPKTSQGIKPINRFCQAP